MTLRERLVALAHARRRERFGASIEGYESLALAAARMALEDAKMVCADESFNAGPNGDLRDVFHDKACANCAAAVSSLREGLG